MTRRTGQQALVTFTALAKCSHNSSILLASFLLFTQAFHDSLICPRRLPLYSTKCLTQLLSVLCGSAVVQAGSTRLNWL